MKGAASILPVICPAPIACCFRPVVSSGRPYVKTRCCSPGRGLKWKSSNASPTRRNNVVAHPASKFIVDSAPIQAQPRLLRQSPCELTSGQAPRRSKKHRDLSARRSPRHLRRSRSSNLSIRAPGSAFSQASSVPVLHAAARVRGVVRVAVIESWNWRAHCCRRHQHVGDARKIYETIGE